MMDPLAIVKGIKTYLNDDYYICGIYIYNIEAGVLMDSNKLCGPQTLSLLCVVAVEEEEEQQQQHTK